MNKKVLVIGSNGQLGLSIKNVVGEYSGFDFVFVSRNEVDLANSAKLTEYVLNAKPDIIINCAAYTAVDKAETDTESADQVNHLAIATLAELAAKNSMVLMHISTDYVFNGQSYKPYIESDLVSPTSIYGKTKLDGELAFKKHNPNGCIIRTSWVYSEYGNNFVKTMIKLGIQREELGVIFDQVGSPTYASDLAKAILEIISNDDNASKLASNVFDDKLFHYSNEGVCSWFDFAKTIFELTNISCHVKPIETVEYPTPAARPHYSLLNKKKIKQTFGISIPYWKDSLSQCVSKLKESN